MPKLANSFDVKIFRANSNSIWRRATSLVTFDGVYIPASNSSSSKERNVCFLEAFLYICKSARGLVLERLFRMVWMEISKPRWWKKATTSKTAAN